MFFVLYRYILYFIIIVFVQIVTIALFFVVKFYIFFCSYTDDFFFILNFFFKPFYVFSDDSVFLYGFFDSYLSDFLNSSNISFHMTYDFCHWFTVYFFFQCFSWFHFVDFFVDTGSFISTTDIFNVFFTTKVVSDDDIVFIPMQRYIVVTPGEPAIVFFKLINNTHSSFKFVSVFDVVPVHAYPYLKKIQCFCFDEILLKRNEILVLPLFFVVDPLLLNDLQVKFSTIEINYSLMKSI